MDLGEFTLVLEDENGRRELPLSATVRAPVVGEWVDVEGRWYQVRLVTHSPFEPDSVDSFDTLPRRLGLTLFAVPVRTGGKNGRHEPARAEGTPPSGNGVRPGLKVIPFEPP